MAQRLSFDERARIEAMYMAGVGVADTARCLGRDPSTIHREFNRGTPGAGGCRRDRGAACRAAASGAKSGIVTRIGPVRRAISGL